MGKARMRGTRIYEISNSKLLYPVKSLKGRSINYPEFGFGYSDVAVDAIIHVFDEFQFRLDRPLQANQSAAAIHS